MQEELGTSLQLSTNWKLADSCPPMKEDENENNHARLFGALAAAEQRGSA